MRLGALQFGPKLGAVAANMLRAQQILDGAAARIPAKSAPTVLVLPEMALTGYAFASREAIDRYLEPQGGISTQWAAEMAQKFDAFVLIGYPEKANHAVYNSVVMVNPQGRTVAHYRKTHLYFADEVWGCQESPDGFTASEVPGLGKMQMGICMDINPWQFQAPPDAYEFAKAAVHHKPAAVLVPMCWANDRAGVSLPFSVFKKKAPLAPLDWLVDYWKHRLPLQELARSRDLSVPVVLANRIGRESTTNGTVVYGGSSTIWDGHKTSSLGRDEEALLLRDVRPAGWAGI